MFQLYSKNTEYILRAFSFLSASESKEKFSPKTLCQRAKVSESFTRKGFQQLVREKILEAVSGPNGGYRFIRKPTEISILEIIEAIEGKGFFDGCVMGLKQCSENKPCPIHNFWAKQKKQTIKMFQTKTIKDLIRSI